MNCINFLSKIINAQRRFYDFFNKFWKLRGSRKQYVLWLSIGTLSLNFASATNQLVWCWESYIISLSLSFLSVKGKYHHLPKCLTHKKMLNKLNIYFFTWFPCWPMSAMKVSGIYFFISTCNLCSGFLIWCQSYPK